MLNNVLKNNPRILFHSLNFPPVATIELKCDCLVNFSSYSSSVKCSTRCQCHSSTNVTSSSRPPLHMERHRQFVILFTKYSDCEDGDEKSRKTSIEMQNRRQHKIHSMALFTTVSRCC